MTADRTDEPDGYAWSWDDVPGLESPCDPPNVPSVLACDEFEKLLDRVARAVAALNEAPDPALVTEPSRAQVLAIQRANQSAWRILTEGRDPHSRRGGSA